MAVTAVVVARMTSTATRAQLSTDSIDPSSKQQIETLLCCTSSPRLDCENVRVGPKVHVSEGIRVQATSVDFNAKQLFQPDVAEMDVSSEVIQKSKLAWLVRSFKRHCVETEYVYKPVCVVRIQVSILIKESDSLCAFSGFDNELD